MILPAFKANFAEILLTELRHFRSEIDIVKLICNIDWPLGYSFFFNEKEEDLFKLIISKGWIYEKRADGKCIIKTKFWWEPSGNFFFIILTKSINMDLFQKSLTFDESKGD